MLHDERNHYKIHIAEVLVIVIEKKYGSLFNDQTDI